MGTHPIDLDIAPKRGEKELKKSLRNSDITESFDGRLVFSNLPWICLFMRTQHVNLALGSASLCEANPWTPHPGSTTLRDHNPRTCHSKPSPWICQCLSTQPPPPPDPPPVHKPVPCGVRAASAGPGAAAAAADSDTGTAPGERDGPTGGSREQSFDVSLRAQRVGFVTFVRRS